MSQCDNIVFDWDKCSDIMYVVRAGIDPDKLSNMDSDKVPGIVKRIDPDTGECVGFIIQNFSKMFPANVHTNEEQLKHLLDISLNLTNERHALRLAS